MVDFKHLVKKKSILSVTDLIKLFESLDRQTSHTELRPAQQQALQMLSERRTEHDLVLKISTGAGKTAIGLLYLASHMWEKEEPVVYLCPTIQLVDQVLTEATKLGINAVVYPKSEPHPHVDGTTAKAIIICTYDKLFNAKTTFDRTDVHLRPCAMVLDDAHAGVEEIRDAFTLRIFDAKIVEKLIKLFNAPCENYGQGIWQAILNNDPLAYFEVPYWIWQPLIGEVQKLLSQHAENKSFIFVWPYLRDILRWCRCIFSGPGIEIVPDIMPINKVEAFLESKHRLFMSATLADDSTLIRELGCDISAAKNPILPKEDKGLGERMVLAPSLVDKSLDRKWIMELCGQLSKRVNVVVLSSSESIAKEWEQYGAKVYIGENVSLAVEELKKKTSTIKFAAFAQRYDGVDLPDSACRILVIDGMPYGEGIVDKYDSRLTSVVGGARNRLIYRIEQGMGRAVRSHVDYAVIILAGPEIANFIAKHDVLGAMNPDTKAQLKLALDLAKLAQESGDDKPGKTLVDMIIQCLKRDEGWKQFYDENVRKIKKDDSAKSDDTRLNMAEAERKSFQFAIANKSDDAVKMLRKALNDNKMSDKEQGWFIQKIANYMYAINPGDALEIQQAARDKNSSLFYAPGVIRKPPRVEKFNVQDIILKWFKDFENPNGAIAAIQELRTRLSYEVSPELIENSILELAPLLGAIGSRPEKEFGEGPDDLWLWPTISLVMEAKTENKDTLHKKDAGQLVLSLQWFTRNYQTRGSAIPIIVAKISSADAKAGFPDGTRVITQSRMQNLLDNIDKFYQQMVKERPLLLTPQRIMELQTECKIAPDQFISEYTIKL